MERRVEHTGDMSYSRRTEVSQSKFKCLFACTILIDPNDCFKSLLTSAPIRNVRRQPEEWANLGEGHHEPKFTIVA